MMTEDSKVMLAIYEFGLILCLVLFLIFSTIFISQRVTARNERESVEQVEPQIVTGQGTP